MQNMFSHNIQYFIKLDFVGVLCFAAVPFVCLRKKIKNKLYYSQKQSAEKILSLRLIGFFDRSRNTI